MSIHHVALTVNNLEESTQWYKEMLGFKKVFSYSKKNLSFVVLEAHSVRLELFNFPKSTQPLAQSSSILEDLHSVGLKHIGIEVGDLDKTIKKLQEKGVEFATELDTAAFGGKYIFIKDCNGIPLELYQK